jgi:isocitrate dehydrogenase
MPRKKIATKESLVVLHGDEMAQIAFEQILEQFVKNRLDLNLLEIDLSAENRLKTNGVVVNEAIEALRIYKVGIKNAGITVNSKQLDDLLKKLNAEGFGLQKEGLAKLATKSPNGTIRKGINGNITREDIPFRNLKRNIPDWVGRDIIVDTMDNGGLKDSFNNISPFSGILKLNFTDSKGREFSLHSRPILKHDIYLLASNEIEKVKQWARDFFQKALDENRPAYVGLKDTVIPGYDGTMRDAVDEIFDKEYKAKFKKANLTYEYGLIDAQAAKIISDPPKRAIWGIPDNTTGRKMYKLVNALKKHGIPQRRHQVSISRMSAGGGDQYGSFNMAAPDDGFITLTIGKRTLHARDVKKGDPLILMSNHPKAIHEWVEYSFKEAEKKKQEIYFGLKREYMQYDAKFSEIIIDVREQLAEGGKTPPALMMMRPSQQIVKMVVDPPMNARYAALNLDGDIFSDITAALGGSLATASSIIASADGTMLFEAPHGTAPDLYEQYINSKGKNAHFNSSALFYAVANAIEVIAEREDNTPLQQYSDAMKEALIATVEQGVITPDLKGKTTQPEKEKTADMHTFLNTIEKNMDKILAK